MAVIFNEATGEDVQMLIPKVLSLRRGYTALHVTSNKS